MSYCLDTSFLVSILFPDSHTSPAFAWLERLPNPIYVSDWAATEFFALIRRRVRTGLVDPEVAEAALLGFEAFAGSRAPRLSQSAPAGARAAGGHEQAEGAAPAYPTFSASHILISD